MLISQERPFVIEHLRTSEQSGGKFVPGARLAVTPMFRTSGLLAFLPDAETKSLILLLTFLTPNGHIQPTLPELAAGLHISESDTRRRLDRLAALFWQGEPLIRAQRAESGLERYSVSAALLSEEVPAMETAPYPAPSYQAAGRDAVVGFNRRAYARSRAEVESEIAFQYGLDPAEVGDGPEAEARRQLIGLGVPRDVVSQLIAEHSLEDIQAQLKWLPLRGAKSPSRFIVAAIQNEYAPPVGARLPEATPPPQEAEVQQEPETQFITEVVSLPIPPEPEETSPKEASV